jgi:hypothetical protein
VVESEQATLGPDSRIVADDDPYSPTVDVTPRVERDVRPESHRTVHEHIGAEVRSVPNNDVATGLGENVHALRHETVLPETHRL